MKLFTVMLVLLAVSGCATTSGAAVPMRADAVSFEDDLRALVATDFTCDAKALTVTANGESRTAATVAGCGKKANYSRVDGKWVAAP